MSQNQENQPGLIERNRSLIKGFLVSFLILALLIPTLFISQLVRERMNRNDEVKREIAQQWGSEQSLTGPLLVVPFWQQEKAEDGKISTVTRYAYFLPDSLNVQGGLEPGHRQRSRIFRLLVYTASLKVNGAFTALPYARLGLKAEQLMPADAFLLYGLSDYTGIQQQMRILWDGSDHAFSAGTNQSMLQKGLYVPMPMTLDDLARPHAFSMDLLLRGAETIRLTPVGRSTTVQLKSVWPHPSFVGKTLPTHDISKQGFTATWNAFDLNREFAQQWKEGTEVNFADSDFGVSLLEPLDHYAKSERSVKYAILLIMLTFVVYFFIEVLQKKQVHAVQYILIGFALCIFYTLLLSISEYLGFGSAYLIAALATVGLITAYTHGIFGKWRTTGLCGGFLSLLYIFIFVLIQLQDGALLVGSIGLFLILASIMYASRKVEWYKS